MKKCKIFATLLALTMSAAALSLAAGAVEPSYTVSNDYKDTLYYDNLEAIELTGDGATDVIAVALSQLGYHEGNDEGDLDGGNVGGNKNFVEYNVLFGKLDNGEGNGYSYGYAWCAAFVNWCLRQARVDEELTGGMFVSCHAWRGWFAEKGAQYGASYHASTDDYIPRKGDLIFYKSLSATHSRTSDHIGIVLGCENGKVYAIEGNGDNRVALHEYTLSDRYIVGYGSIAYKTADVPEVDYYRTKDHLPGQFVAGSGTLTAYSGPSSQTEKVGKLTPNAVYRIVAVDGNFGRIDAADGSSVWVSLKRFTPMTTDAHVSVTLVYGEERHSVLVAKGASWSIPEASLLEGVPEDLLGWSDGKGEVLSPGQSIVLNEDTVLQAYTASQIQDTTEVESEAAGTDTAGEQASDATVESTGESVRDDASGSADATTDDAQTDAVSNGCSSTVGAGFAAAFILSVAAACFKKRD